MTDRHTSDSIILFSDAGVPARIAPQRGNPMHDREHVISVVLNNEDWKAFVQLQPEPVTWLRERIRETIAASRPQTQTTPRQTTSPA